jgi:hypothetical protein
MPRYFFDLHDGDGLVWDEGGQNLDCIEGACCEAQRKLAELVRDLPPDGRQRTIAMRVRDETGRAVVKAGLSIMVEHQP